MQQDTRRAFIRSLLVGVFGASFVVVSASGSGVTVGMSPQEVTTILGPPDKRAVLVGKVLRELREGAPDPTESRMVYIYDRTKLRVWFQHGQVTGMTLDGLPVTEGERQ